jgi:hypothetical protein
MSRLSPIVDVVNKTTEMFHEKIRKKMKYRERNNTSLANFWQILTRKAKQSSKLTRSQRVEKQAKSD